MYTRTIIITKLADLFTSIVNWYRESNIHINWMQYKCSRCSACPGGVLRFELDRGVPLEPQNPYPSLRVILAKKGTHFWGFFFKNRPIFQKFRDFGGFCMVKPRKSRNLGLSQKSWPMFKDFLGKKQDPCLRISCKKATH